MHPSDIDSTKHEPEVSLVDIINFLKESWKKLAVASIVGAVLGLSSWFIFGTYSAEYVLFNNSYSDYYDNGQALDLVSWRLLQKSLPNLAGQIIDENKVPENQSSIYRSMSSEEWWQKNVVPTYILSKADIKDLAGIGKKLDLASSSILNLTLSASGTSKEQAINNVKSVAKFLYSGRAYLQLRSLLNSYESLTVSRDADLRQKITNAQIEMRLQQERVKNLEELRKRFPSNASDAVINQKIDASGDDGSKFLPLTTQIIAANTNIHQLQEKITILKDGLDQIMLSKTFLDQALPLQNQTFDGLTLNKQLLEIEANLRAKLVREDGGDAQFLNDLRAKLVFIQVFSNYLVAYAEPAPSGKKGVIRATAGGLAAAFFFMLLVLLGQRTWQIVKSSGTK